MATLTSTATKSLTSTYHEKVLQDIAKRNKKCFDRQKPSPTCVNMQLGTFVCIECSGILRELDFRCKGISLSTFTPQEVSQIDLAGGNKRAAEIWLGKHPDGEKARQTGGEDTDSLRRFLIKKYKEKAWYDAAAASRPVDPVARIERSDSNSSLSELPSSQGRRTRTGSNGSMGRGAAALLGQDSHRSFLAATHARAAAASAMGKEAESDSDSDDSFAEIVDPVERQSKQKAKIREQIVAFYQVHNPEKLDSLDVFVEWVMYHGMHAFNKKLREKYGVDIQIDKKRNSKKKMEQKERRKRDKKEGRPDSEVLRQAQQLAELEAAAQQMALHDLAERRGRTGSTNPFDDIPSAQQQAKKTDSLSSNPFEELMFL